jgi:hypothetical protein
MRRMDVISVGSYALRRDLTAGKRSACVEVPGPRLEFRDLDFRFGRSIGFAGGERLSSARRMRFGGCEGIRTQGEIRT